MIVNVSDNGPSALATYTHAAYLSCLSRRRPYTPARSVSDSDCAQSLLLSVMRASHTFKYVVGLYVRRFSLNLIHDLIGKQCRDLSRDLDSESLLDLVTILARQFCTHYKRVLKNYKYIATARSIYL